jgi:hypothetical protein
MTWASRAVSSPSVPFGGRARRQIGQTSLSCSGGRGDGGGLEDGEDDAWSRHRRNPGSASNIDLTRGLLLGEGVGLVIVSTDEYRE